MLTNYLKIALRNLTRHSAYSLINLIGLSVGLTIAILISLFVRNEYAYNRSIPEADRTYRVLRAFRQAGSTTVEEGLSGAIVPELRRSSPEVEACLRWAPERVWVRVGDRTIEQVLVMTESPALSFFGIQILKGSAADFHQHGGGVLLSERMADALFGDEDPIGRTITVEGREKSGDYRVSAVVQEPPKSTVMFDFLVSEARITDKGWRWDSWVRSGYSPSQVYLRLREAVDPEVIEQRLDLALRTNIESEIAEQSRYHLQPFTRVYLHSKRDFGMQVQTFRAAWTKLGDINAIEVSILVAGLILLIACVNFTNLSTARSLTRAREIGIRKAIGAYRRQIVGQFLGEAILLAVLSMLVAMFFVELTLPTFNALVDRQLVFDHHADIGALLVITAAAIVTGVLAGSYPAFVLSRLGVISDLADRETGTGGWVRKGLVVTQFAVSAVLIVATVVVQRQIDYIQTKDLGFDRDQMVIVPIFWEARNAPGYGRYGIDLKLRFQEVKRAFLDHPDVLAAGVSRFYLQEFVVQGELEPEGVDGPWRARIFSIDDTFLETMNIPIVEGRGFSPEYASVYERERRANGTPDQYLINEAAARQLGWEESVGKRLMWHSRNAIPGTVIGVVKDFHIQTLHAQVEPTVFDVNHWNNKMVMLKIAGTRIPETLTHLESVWNRYLPSRPFQYEFLDEKIDGYYRSERRQSQVFGTFALMAIFVACLGLLGLASFSAQQRTKEMGIRKVVGASTSRLVAMISQDFVRVVLAANLVALPFAWWLMRSWLDTFAFRVDLAPDVFLVAGMVTIGIALATVSSQAWKAANTNPVDTLREQ